MSDIEERAVKNVEQTTLNNAKAKRGDKALESHGEILHDDNPAPKFFDFVLQSQGWAKEMAMRLGLPADLVNTQLPVDPMTPSSIPRNWLPQARIPFKADWCCLFRTLGHTLCGKDSRKEDPDQLHVTVRKHIQEQ